MAKVGRPKVIVDWDRVNDLCRIHCTAEEISSVLKVSEDILLSECKRLHKMNLSEYIKTHSAQGKMSLRRSLWKNALEGNTTAQIWLSKQLLGYRDSFDANLNTNVNHTFTFEQFNNEKVQQIISSDPFLNAKAIEKIEEPCAN